MTMEASVDAAVEAGDDPRYQHDLTPEEVDERLPAYERRELQLQTHAVRQLMAERTADPHFDREVAQLYVDLWVAPRRWNDEDPKLAVLSKRLGLRADPCSVRDDGIEEFLFDYEYADGALKLALMMSDAARSIPNVKRYLASVGCSAEQEDFEPFKPRPGGWSRQSVMYSEDFLTVPPQPGDAPSSSRSPWLAFRGAPSSRGAMGWLLTASPEEPRVGEVRWVSGGSSSPLDLLATPEPMFVPLLSPLRSPAVFAVEGDEALVWSPSRGWGWINRFTEKRRDMVIAIEKDLDMLQGATAADAAKKGPDGVAQHERSLLIVLEQAVHSTPEAGAPVVAQVAREMSCGGQDDIRSGAPALIVERRGDWVNVRLGAVLGEDPKDGLKKRVKWHDQPSGWVKLFEPGPVADTGLRMWCGVRWGP